MGVPIARGSVLLDAKSLAGRMHSGLHVAECSQHLPCRGVSCRSRFLPLILILAILVTRLSIQPRGSSAVLVTAHAAGGVLRWIAGCAGFAAKELLSQRWVAYAALLFGCFPPLLEVLVAETHFSAKLAWQEVRKQVILILCSVCSCGVCCDLLAWLPLR